MKISLSDSIMLFKPKMYERMNMYEYVRAYARVCKSLTEWKSCDKFEALVCDMVRKF